MNSVNYLIKTAQVVIDIGGEGTGHIDCRYYCE